MKKVILGTKIADFKQGKFIDEEVVTVVASTKSQNNFTDEIKKSGRIIATETSRDIFLSKEKTLSIIDRIEINDILEDDKLKLSQQDCDLIKKHIKSILNNGCLFKVNK